MGWFATEAVQVSAEAVVKVADSRAVANKTLLSFNSQYTVVEHHHLPVIGVSPATPP